MCICRTSAEFPSAQNKLDTNQKMLSMIHANARMYALNDTEQKTNITARRNIIAFCVSHAFNGELYTFVSRQKPELN